MMRKVGLERRIKLGRTIRMLDFKDERHKRFRDKATAILTEAATFVGSGAQAVSACGRWRLCHVAVFSIPIERAF
jgi:hypothetical protein